MSNRRKSNRLAVLAADIRAAHEDVARSSKLTAERAVDAGRLLSEAKAREDIPRGGWERWVEGVAGVPWSTAKRYIQLFVAVEEDRLSVADISEAGQIGALRAAAEPSEEQSLGGAAVEADEDGWTPDQLKRKAEAEAGRCVVANMHDGFDVALLSWADAEDRFVRIDRRTDWGNVFEMPEDGGRPEVVGKFSKFYLPYKDGLLSRMPSLRGKVLGCWCHPEECHGHIIAEIVNAEAEGKGSAAELADRLAEADG
jgi:hypothetical protein